MIKTRAEAAVTYNDVSVNENAHLALGALLLLLPLLPRRALCVCLSPCAAPRCAALRCACACLLAGAAASAPPLSSPQKN